MQLSQAKQAQTVCIDLACMFTIQPLTVDADDEIAPKHNNTKKQMHTRMPERTNQTHTHAIINCNVNDYEYIGPAVINSVGRIAAQDA